MPGWAMFLIDIVIGTILTVGSLLICIGLYLLIQAARGKLPSWVPEKPPMWWPGQDRQ